MIFDFLLGSQVGLPWHKSGSPGATPGGQHHNFHTNLKIVSNFLVARLGYQQPKSGSPSKFKVAWGYRATTKSYTEPRIDQSIIAFFNFPVLLKLSFCPLFSDDPFRTNR